MKNKVIALPVLLWALLSGSAGATTVSVFHQDVVAYDPNNTYEFVGDLGPNIFWAGLTFVDPSHALSLTLNAPSDLPGTLDYLVSNGPNATGLPYASSSILPGESGTVIIGGAPQASPSNPFTIYFAMQAPGLSTSIPFGGSSGNDIIAPAVPIPPAVWLFGSGLLGLVGMARNKKTA